MLKVVGASWVQTRISGCIIAGVGLLGIGILLISVFSRLVPSISQFFPSRCKRLETKINYRSFQACFFIFLCIFCPNRGRNDGMYSATVFWNDKGGYYRIDFWGQGNDLVSLPKGAARAYYRPRIQDTG